MFFKKINRASLEYFIAAFVLLVLVFVILIGRCNEAYGQKKPVKDSLPQEKIYIIRIKESDLRGKIDTLSGVVNFVGRSLSVDNATQLQNSFNVALNGLLKYAVVDSSTVTKKTK